MNSTENCVLVSDNVLNKVVPVSPPSPALSPVPVDEVPPQFKTTLVDIDVMAGSSAKFVVQVFNPSQSLKVSWYHNGYLVVSCDHNLLFQEGDFYCVQINQVTPKDEGQWTCRAENPAGGMSTCCILHVTCPPVFCAPEFVSGLRGCLWENGTISLECEVKGRPTPSLKWYKDGSQILEGASLTIRASSKEPETLLGTFACEAQNCMGSRALYSKVYAKQFCDFLQKISQHGRQKQIQY